MTVHRRVLQPVLLATTVFCVSAALMMVLIGVATAGRAPGSCSVNEQRFVRAICELPATYWFGCALCIGKDERTAHETQRAVLSVIKVLCARA